MILFFAVLLTLVADRVAVAILNTPGVEAQAAVTPDALAELRKGAKAVLDNSTAALRGETERLAAASQTALGERVAAATAQRGRSLENVNLASEVALRSTKRALDEARQVGAQKARAAAAMQATIAQNMAEKELSLLVNRAQELEVEAQQRYADAMEAAASTDAAALSARGWRSKWPKDEIKSAIDLAKEANTTAPRMRDLAASADSVAELVDNVAVDLHSVLDEAMERVRNADLLARTAVDQATQNSLKLKAIRGLVLDAEKAVASGEMSQPKGHHR